MLPNESIPLNNNNKTTPSEESRNIFETLLVLLFLPAAFATHKLAHLITSDPPVWTLLMALCLLVGFALALATPRQKWTTVALGLELTGATVIFPKVPPHTVLVIASCSSWFLYIFLVLSLKGVKRSEMGHIGTLADMVIVVLVGIGQLVFNVLKGFKGVVLGVFDGSKGVVDGVKGIVDGVKGIVDGVEEIVLGVFDALQSVWGRLWGIDAKVDIEAQTNAVSGSGNKAYPPPYREFTFSDSYVFSKG